MATRGGQRWRASVRIATRRLWARTGAIFRGAGGDVDGRAAGALAEADERTRVAGELKGGVAKAGQLAGYLEVGGAARLVELCSAVPAVPAQAVREVIQEDLGQPPEVLFAAFEAVPFAAASLGQVHAARGHDGAEYAVKVQFPGIAAALRDDLGSKSLVRSLTGVGAPHLDAAALAALAQAVAGELDYQAEGRWIERFRTAFAGAAGIAVPRWHPALSSARVLTMERMTGRPLGELAGADAGARAAAARALFRFAWGAPLEHGLLNADPNPGNYLVGPDAVAFLDFGCSLALAPELVEPERALWHAITGPDQGRGGEPFRVALNQLGLITRASSFDSTRYREWEAAVTAPFRTREFSWDAGYAAGLIAGTRELLAGELLELPAGALLLWRQRLGVAAVLGRLAPRLDFRAELTAILQRARDRGGPPGPGS